MSGLGWGLVATAWVLVGAGVAGLLLRQGQPGPTALAALACWPLLLPLLAGVRPSGGPYGTRIDEALDRLDRALREVGEPLPEDVRALGRALHQADARVARFDRLRLDAADAEPIDRLALEQARARAAAEVEAVLAEVVRMRVQVGLAALAEGAPLRARLVELSARVGGVGEAAAIGSPA